MLDKKLKVTLKDASRKLTGPRERAFMANVTEDYCDGSARKAETYLGWKRHTVQLGLHDSRSAAPIGADRVKVIGKHSGLSATIKFHRWPALTDRLSED
jgi:hypothetical protein